MPELPEVETVRRQLAPYLVGRTFLSVEVFHAKTVNHDDTIEDRLSGHTIAAVNRTGKLLLISLETQPDLFLLIHLKMTGQLLFVPTHHAAIGGGHTLDTATHEQLPGRHTRSAFHFTDESSLYFNDLRLFGYTKLANRATVEAARAGFGPEPTDPTFDRTWFSRELRRRRTPVKAALLDQRFVAGLGNIYVDEALFRAGVRPGRSTAHLTQNEAQRIGTEAGTVMREAIAVGGTTFQHFIDTGGIAGNFTDYLQVFGRQGSPCHICGSEIKKIRVAGRGTHYCPHCQR